MIDAVSKRGSAEDLGFLLEQCASADGFPAEVRATTMSALADAATARGVLPAVEPQVLTPLLVDSDAVVQLAALRLATRWKDPAFGEPLIEASRSSELNEQQAEAIYLALAANGSAPRALPPQSEMVNRASRIASLAAGALASTSDIEAQEAAVAWILAADPSADIAPVVRAFLNRQGGAEQLASMLSQNEVTQDQAAASAPHDLRGGSGDESLLNLLTEKAGLEAENEPWTAERMASEVQMVMTEGDPARGEDVFRRADLNCFNCHALSGAGGQIGPDLSPVGVSSPPDYLIHAIINPAQDVKEVYQVHKIMTLDGLVISESE
ncbi:MAG: c-type cytochrome [Pirellulaceae bacterium]